MTEIEYLKCKLEDTEKAFDKLHKRHIELLKQQGKLEKENEELKKEADYFERKKCEYWNMYNKAHLDRIILEEENEELKQKLENLDLNEENDTVKMIDGKVFIKM